MNNKAHKIGGVAVYICECGPILAGALKLDELQNNARKIRNVACVKRFSTICSPDGLIWLADDIRTNGCERVVIAGCTPREHENDFREALRAAGVNPFLLTVANIREQCAWTCADKEEATLKASLIVKAAVARCAKQLPLKEESTECSCDVVIIGSGAAGLTAAKYVAEAGRKVYLVEREACAGGRVNYIDKIYPQYECSSCMIEPLMDEVLRNENVELLAPAEIESAAGYYGAFKVEISIKPRGSDFSVCCGCGSCFEVCPVSVPNQFDFGLSNRKAIYVPYAGAIPNAPVIDAENCLRFKGEECSACAQACPFQAIDLSAKTRTVTRTAGAIIIATGASQSAFEVEEEAADLIFSTEAFERMSNSSGPTGGKILTREGRPPKSVAFFTFGGTTPGVGLEKYAVMLRRQLPETDVYLFSKDAVADETIAAIEAASGEKGGKLRKYRLSGRDSVSEIRLENGAVRAVIDDRGATLSALVDMVVVDPPLKGSDDAKRLADILRVPLDANGFFKPAHAQLKNFAAPVDGVFLAGCAAGPMRVAQSTTHAAAAACAALSGLTPGKRLAINPYASEVDNGKCSGCRTCLSVCPYAAATFDEENRQARVNRLLCRGCGVCAAACPSGAIIAPHFTNEQIEAEISAYLEDEREANSTVIKEREKLNEND